MSINSLGQYSATFKPYDHVGNIVPDIEHSEGERPAGDFWPAAWLPVKFYDKHYENWMTIMPGKILALDPDGRLMPAQYGLTSATVTYTQNDIDAGVIDIATGAAVTTAKTVTLSNLTGEKDPTWTAANAGVGAVTSGFMGRFGVAFDDSTVKYPVGVCPYPMIQWAGDGSTLDDGFNPVAYRQTNYNMQHRAALLCDYVIKLPLIPGQVTSEALPTTWTGSAVPFTGAGGWRTRTWIQATDRYNSSTGTFPCLDTYPVVACSLDNRPIAKNTTRTTITSSSTTLLVTERDSLAEITQAGDWWMDYEMGVLFVYSATGSSLPVSGATTITYYHYATAPTVVSSFGCVVATTTELVRGEYLKCDSNSNFVRADPASDNFATIVGQVLQVIDYPKDNLEYVRTAYNPALRTASVGTMANQTAGSSSANLGQLDQLTGSATGGVPTLVTYAGGANKIVVVNLIGR